MAYVSRQGTDKMVTTINLDGTYTDQRFNAGTNMLATAWSGSDLDGDGLEDMVASSRDTLYLVSIDDADISNITYTTLGSVTVGDTDGSNGTGGKVFAAGKDYNGDGVNDIIATKGGNSSGNRINIWDPTDGTQIASYNADTCRGIGAAIWGEDQNGDGIEDLWVTDAYRNSIRAYDIANGGAYIGVVDLGITLKSPQDMIKTEDGTVYIGTRFSSDLGEHTAGEAYGQLIKWDPVNGASLVLELTALRSHQ